MTEAQADQIIDYISGMLRPPDPIETRRSWKLQLLPLDADLASRAAINGMENWEFFPSWPKFYAEYRSLKKVSVPEVSCATCQGDKFVLVSLRKPQQSEWMRLRGITPATDSMYEEMAPCPDCNADADTTFRRPDGTEVRSPDPAEVRRMMTS